jgi:alpha-tubulin suppressor-like RCC1 family protein
MLADRLRNSPIRDYLVSYNLYSWGENGSGELGIGNTTDKSSPNQVGSETRWTDISSGTHDDVGKQHSLAIDNNQRLWAWGENGNGQLGIGNTTDKSSPIQVGTDKWLKISAGYAVSHGIKHDNTLWGWGYWNNSNIGSGSFSDVTTPSQILSGSGDYWIEVSSRYNHSFAITNVGVLFTWGTDLYGETGLGYGPPVLTTISTPETVTPTPELGWKIASAGNRFSLAIQNDGTLWAWGEDTYGQIGLNGGGSGMGYESVPVQVGALTTWKNVSAGGGHSLALKNDGTIWSWGYNGNGQLGHGDTTDRSSPTQIGSATDWVDISAGYEFSLALKSDGSLYAWGLNNIGQLGDGSTTTRLTPRQIGTNTIKYRNIDAGFDYSMGLRE